MPTIKWTTNTPAKPGWYWRKIMYICGPLETVVHVYPSLHTYEDSMERPGYPVEVPVNGFEMFIGARVLWAGPITQYPETEAP